MRLAARTDRNHKEIVRVLRQLGASVCDLSGVGHGCPDILVGFRGKTHLMEIKDGLKSPCRRRLTPDEQEWHESWRGRPVAVVESVPDALEVIGVGP